MGHGLKEIPRGAFRSSSLAFQYRFTCASETFDARSSVSLFTGAGACALIANSFDCPTTSPSPSTSTSSGIGSGVEVSDVRAFTRVSLLASSVLPEAGRVGLVTLFAEEWGPKARVCWEERGWEDLRRDGGMIVGSLITGDELLGVRRGKAPLLKVGMELI